MADRRDWDRRYSEGAVERVRPILVLVANVHLLPRTGRALDLACGLGGNARLLAGRGLQTQAWDQSPVAIDKINAYAQRAGLPLRGQVRDVERDPPEPESFDVITVGHYLDRAGASDLIRALRPGGVLFYQTYTRECVDVIGPRRSEYRLAINELLELFAGLRVLVYREEGRVGDLRIGWRNEAMLVAVK